VVADESREIPGESPLVYPDEASVLLLATIPCEGGPDASEG
jgi:hypothetical protein